MTNKPNIVIRENVFETNSSSMHTVIISNKKKNIHPGQTGVIDEDIVKIRGKKYLFLKSENLEFGRQLQILETQFEKFSYVFARFAETKFEFLSSLVKKYFDLEGIVIEPECESYNNNEPIEYVFNGGLDFLPVKECYASLLGNYYNFYGSIDHQSIDVLPSCIMAMKSFDEFKGLSDDECLEKVIFDFRFVIVVDDDGNDSLRDLAKNAIISRNSIKYVLEERYNMETNETTGKFVSFKKYCNRSEEDE